MRPISRRIFDVYALSRVKGHAFGDRPPLGAFLSDDGLILGILTRCERSRYFGVECMRRRTDGVWSLTRSDSNLMPYLAAKELLQLELAPGQAPLPVPPGEPVRPALTSIGPKGSNEVFRLLFTRSHLPAAWALNEVYLAFPRPDPHWVRDLQTGNFHTRLWEAYLLACFREQGCVVTQDYPSPDFCVGRHGYGHVWVEAVTANEIPYDHVVKGPDSKPIAPQDPVERQIGKAAVRFAKTIRTKLQKKYTEMKHVHGQPFAIGIADFHEHGSMMWSREALMAYLYGSYAVVEEADGRRAGVSHTVDVLRGTNKIPAGLFRRTEYSNLSAIIFSNAGTIAKFNRMGYLAGFGRGLRMVRSGAIFDRRPGALEPYPFSLDISSRAYAELWPGYGEAWSAELEVFHNPLAEHPLPQELFPECAHWMVNASGGIGVRSFHKISILSSTTLVTTNYDEKVNE